MQKESKNTGGYGGSEYGSPDPKDLLKIAGQLYGDTSKVDSMIVEGSTNLQSNTKQARSLVEQVARASLNDPSRASQTPTTRPVPVPTPQQAPLQVVQHQVNQVPTVEVPNVQSTVTPPTPEERVNTIQEPSPQTEFSFVRHMSDEKPYAIELLEDIVGELKSLNRSISNLNKDD